MSTTQSTKEEPTRSRLSVSLDRILPHQSSDAFKEASYNEVDYRHTKESEIEFEPGPEPLPDIETESPVSPSLHEAAPQPLRFDRPESKTKRVGGKRSGVALLLATLSIGGLAYVWHAQHQQVLDFGAEKSDMAKMFASIGDEINGALSAIQNIELWRPEVDAAIEKVESINARQIASDKKVANLEARLAEQNTAVANLQVALADKEQTIGNLRQSLTSIASEQQKLARAKSSPAPSSSRSPVQESYRPPSPDISTTIAGATVQSIDTWGSSQFAILLTSTGEWSSVPVGGTVDGWELTGITDSYALFSQGPRKLKVKIGG
ncbi:hypothetical protein DOK_11726 [gamma proteobacterium BDW918]|nr:hypothetical protein DOK_11726 [gamma proteobacterium BDW918]